MLKYLTENAIAPLFLLVGTVLGSLIPGLLSRRKTSAEAESTLSSAIMGFVKILQTEISSLRTQVDRTQGELADAQKRLLAAQAKVNELEDILRRAEEEKQEDKELISKLIVALRQFDPKNPLLAS